MPESEAKSTVQTGFLRAVNQAQQLLTQVHENNLQIAKLREEYVRAAMPEKEKSTRQ
jgi:hypothetical protein